MDTKNFFDKSTDASKVEESEQPIVSEKDIIAQEAEKEKKEEVVKIVIQQPKEEPQNNELLSLFTNITSKIEALGEKISSLETSIATISENQKKSIDDIRKSIDSENIGMLNSMHDFHILIDSMQTQLDEKQERLETINQNVQEDRYRKDKIKLLNRCIMQLDIIRKTLYEFKNESDSIENKEEYLLQQLQEIVKGMEATLSYEGIETKRFTNIGDKINTEYQEAVKLIYTDDTAKEGIVAESINPGYVWTLPYILKGRQTDTGEEIKTYRFLLQSEQVAVYKYRQNETPVQTSEE